MKRILFHNPRLFFGVIICFAFSACQKQTSVSNTPILSEEIETAKPDAKPNTLAEVLVKLTVNDAGTNLTSDGGGDYVNGSQAVGAKFDAYGNFIFSCGTSGKGPNAIQLRWLNIDFNSPIQVFINPPITGSDKVTAITTISVAAYAFIPLQSLAVGQSECVGLTGGSGADWTMNFHRAAEDVPGSPSAYAVFTRTSSTQWTVTPIGSCSPNSNVCALRNGPGVLYGYYNMPFSITLTKL